MLHETQRTSAPSRCERLDQHGGLHGHVQAAHDARAGERRLARVARAQRHQAGHLLLGEADLVAPELGERRGRRPCTAACPARGPRSNGWVSDATAIRWSLRWWWTSVGRRAAGRPSPRTLRGRARPARRRARASARRSRPACGERRLDRRPAEAEPDVAHGAAVLLVRVRQDVGDHEPPAGAQHARDLGQRGATDRRRGAGGARRARGRATRTRAAAPRCGPRTSCDVAEAGEPRARDLEHLGRGVDGDDRARRTARAPRRCGPSRSRDRRRRRRGRAARAGAAGRWSRRTARRAARPTRRRRRRRTRAVSRSAPVQHLLAPAQVEPHGDRVREALAHELPEPARGLVELVDRERVVAARAVAPGGDPAGVGEQLEVPRDGGLRQRERVAQLDDRQLDAVEAREHAAARGVGEQAELAEQAAVSGCSAERRAAASIRQSGL